jgi:pimeloyl-ACP methyl ester carboxylesterase
MQPVERKIAANDNHLMVYEWGEARADHPDLIFLHATGMHGRCWDAVIGSLGGFHCYAVDALGHGQSDKPAPPHSWQAYGDDVTELARLLGLKGAIGVGHSMGGNSVTRATAALPQAFAALLLVDPVILPTEWYALNEYSIEGHFVLNRRREWASPDEMFASFKGRGPFKNWRDDVLRDYCDYGLIRDGDHFRLACSPETEAHVYSSTALKTGIDIYDAVKQVNIPVRVLRCAKTVSLVGFDLMDSPTAPDLASRFSDGADIVLEHNSHFIPMESPEIVAVQVRELVEGEK